MTSPHDVVQVEGTAYTIVADRRLELVAFIVGQAIDELTGRGPAAQLQLRARLHGLPDQVALAERRFSLTTGEGGAFAVAGVPELALPDLPLNACTVDLEVAAAAYLRTATSVTIPAGTTVFPLPALSLVLRRPAIQLRGRVTTTGVASTPVAGASVAVVDPPDLVGFRAPLAFGHDTATPVRLRALVPVAPDLSLAEDVPAGAREVPLERRIGLLIDSIVQLGSGVEREYGVVESIGGPSDPARAGRVRLRAPLAYRHPRGEAGPRLAVAGAITDQTHLSRSAFMGDQSFFVTDATIFAADQAFEVLDASPARPEYRVASPPAATTDSDGYYRIGPVGRVRSARLRVTPPAAAPKPDIAVTLDYDQPDNVLNVRV